MKKLCSKDSYIICADGGANATKKAGIIPNIIIGDFDSISKSALKFFTGKKTILLKITEQETTDLEKSLMYIIANGLDNVKIFGAFGSRPDHTLNNFSVLKRYSKVLDIHVYDEMFETFFIDKKTEFKYRKGQTISLMPMPIATGITTKGLMYPLNNESLELGIREGTLNLSTRNSVSVEFKKGELLLFRKHFL
ncbi:MAG: thiamine diphosphokinase [Bacteroidetes bacterium]|nr:thiamine diphosphokinase [Bacteroidota bacterium]